MSFRLSNDSLFKDFNEAGGYKLLVDMLTESSAEDTIDEKQVKHEGLFVSDYHLLTCVKLHILCVLENLLYVGQDQVDFSNIEGSPYQHDGM